MSRWTVGASLVNVSHLGITKWTNHFFITGQMHGRTHGQNDHYRAPSFCGALIIGNSQNITKVNKCELTSWHRGADMGCDAGRLWWYAVWKREWTIQLTNQLIYAMGNTDIDSSRNAVIATKFISCIVNIKWFSWDNFRSFHNNMKISPNTVCIHFVPSHYLLVYNILRIYYKYTTTKFKSTNI